ncbi:MAG TPA: hypothetical protein VKA13_04300 [Gammaproteobacteria bacterium]|nr:hypothetical protein [Gammaproteobacteria bacterium]
MEAFIYIIVAISSLTMITYVVHMFIGGLVSPGTEHSVMAVVLVVWASVIGVMAWDIIRRRRQR